MGYWKATGADKPVTPKGAGRPLGIKKALVFYSGKAPRGAKTDWIMHEYRLPDANRAASKKGSLRVCHRQLEIHKFYFFFLASFVNIDLMKRFHGFMQLDDWVLCRLYNKKNTWEKMRQQKEEASFGETMDSLDDTGSDSFRTPESDIDNDVVLPDIHDMRQLGAYPSQASNGIQAVRANTTAGYQPAMKQRQKEENEWFMDLKLDDLQSSYMGFGSTSAPDMLSQDYYSSNLPQLRSNQNDLPPF